uniref:C-type lectin domain-containing protein n=1 Tax=Poecilia formosa TaxID=48698 RepID=A0A087YEH2_POEFO
MESLNASLQQSYESIKDLHHLQWSIQENKDRLASVSAALQQLAVLDSLSRTVDGLKCSLEQIVSNDTSTLSRLWSVEKALSNQTEWLMSVQRLAKGSVSVSDGCCPLGWETFGSSCYLFSRSALSWHEARDWCNGHESHLVILMSDEEWDFVTRLSAGSFYWVGLTDEKSGRWEWVNQTPYVMNRRRWKPGQPDSWTGHGLGPGDEDCAHIHNDGRLNDLHCSTRLRYICQR